MKDNSVQKPRRLLWNLRWSCFFQVGCIAQLSVYEAVHMTEQGLSGTRIGLLLALANALVIFTSPLWGRIADQYQFYRRLVGMGTLGLSATLVWFAFADSNTDFLIYVILRGLLTTSVMGVMPALALANLPQEGQGKGYGGYRSYGSIGFMAATFILPALLPIIFTIILTASVLLPISLIFIFGLQRPAPRTAQEEKAFQGKLPPLLYWFLAAHFLVCMTEPAINGFYNSFARTLGSPLEWIGVISGFNGFIAFISLPLIGMWVDKRGPELILMLGFAAQGLRLFTASFITLPEFLWIPQLFHSFGWAGREVATIVFITLLAGPTRRATAVTLAISTKMAGMMVGSFLMGSLSDLYGYPVMFRIIAALAGCSLVFLVFVLRKRRSPDEGL